MTLTEAQAKVIARALEKRGWYLSEDSDSFCPKCGNVARMDEAKFCPMCGVKLAIQDSAVNDLIWAFSRVK